MNLSRLVALVGIALAGAACTTPASHLTAAPVEDDASEPVVAAAEDPRVCKRIVPTGTRVAQRTCMRRSEWARSQGNGQEMLEEVQRRGVQTGNVTGQ